MTTSKSVTVHGMSLRGGALRCPEGGTRQMGNCTVVHDGNSKAYPYQFSRVYGETLEALNDLTSDGRMDYRTLGDILQLLGRLSDASLHDQELAVMRFRLRLDEIRRSRRDESSPDVDRLRAERDPYPHTE